MGETVEKIYCCDRDNNDALAAAILANGQQHSWTASQVKKSMESLGLSIPGKVTTGDVTYAANMAYADFYPDPLKDEAACLRYAHKVANDPRWV